MAVDADMREAEEDSTTSCLGMAMELSCVLRPDCPATFHARPFHVSCSRWKQKSPILHRVVSCLLAAAAAVAAGVVC